VWLSRPHTRRFKGGWMLSNKISFLALRGMSTAAAPPAAVVSLIQMNASSNKERNFETCARLISQVVASNSAATSSSLTKTQLICLPECFSFIGENSFESIEAAEDFHESCILQKYQNLAIEFDLWLSLGGFQELRIVNEQRKVSNLHVIINPKGEILPENCYRKVSGNSASLLSQTF
jgi:predicted amidohydrolase